MIRAFFAATVGTGCIAFLQTVQIKDWVSIAVGITTGVCLIYTTFFKVRRRPPRDRERRRYPLE
jgi:hypothetical protein